MSVITVRATAKTPPELRHLNGRTYPIRYGITPGIGESGVLHGIPGTMREGWIWEIGTETPPPRVASAQLGDLLTILIEIRDLLREASTRWSPAEAASTGSSTAADTTPTGPSDAKA